MEINISGYRQLETKCRLKSNINYTRNLLMCVDLSLEMKRRKKSLSGHY